MLAGIHDPRAASDPGRLARRVTAPSANDGPIRTASVGPLAALVSGSGGQDPSAPQGCLLDGSIFNVGDFADELGLDPRDPVETLLARAYERRGPAMLERLRGAFALVAWADGGRRVLIAQDQVGVRALFLHRSGSELAFGSEVCHLLPLLRQRPAPDRVSMVRYLAMTWIYDRRTMYEGVTRLGAGHCITIEDSRVEERRYWYPRYQPPLEGSRLEIAAELRSAVVRAVETRTRGVANLGIMLSGGFDSGSVASAASAVREPGAPQLCGYSAVFPDDPAMDERDLLDALQRELGIANVRMHVKPGGLLALHTEWVERWQLPLWGGGAAVEYGLLRRAASDGVEVMLDGQGGDEIFGHAIYVIADWLRRGRLDRVISLLRGRAPGGAPWKWVLVELKNSALRTALPYPAYRALRRLPRRGRRAPEWLVEECQQVYVESNDDLLWAREPGGRPRWWLAKATELMEDRETSGLGDYVRQRSTWVGIEPRPPLFDVDLIELALRLPPELGFDAHLDRPLAREAMAGLLPDELRLSHRKSNLAPLIMASLSGPDLNATRSLLGDDAEVFAYVRPESLKRHLDNPPTEAGPASYDFINALDGCAAAELWLRSQADPSFPARFREAHGLRDPEVEELPAA